MPRPFLLRAVLLLAVILWGGQESLLFAESAAATGEWKILHFKDREYISSGSIKEFYHFDENRVINETLWLTSPTLIMKAGIHGRELRLNGVKFTLNEPVETIEGETCFSRLDLSALIDPLMRPVPNKGGAVFDTVVIDPGHGGKDTGARNNINEVEKDLALRVGLALKADLEKRGLKVVMTRVKDVLITEPQRIAAANKVPNSIFISLHYGCLAPGTAGVGTCVQSPRGSEGHPAPSREKISQNLQLASVIQSTVMSRLKGSLADRGIDQAYLVLLAGINQPAVLIEPGVLSAGNDAQYANQKTFPTDLVHAIGDAVEKYRKNLK